MKEEKQKSGGEEELEKPKQERVAPPMAPMATPSMSMAEKLAMIDQEIRTLHQFCIDNGYNPEEVHRSAKPLINYVRFERGKKWLKCLPKVAIVVAIIAAVLSYDPAARVTKNIGRRALIAILPYWDWTKLHDDSCMVPNPYMKSNEINTDDCELCENIEQIKRLSNVSQRVVAEDYLKRDIPFIVTDAMENWPAVSKFNINFLHDLYNQDELLQKIWPCVFHSNVRTPNNNVWSLLRKATSGYITNWYAYWENCEKAGKSLRAFYSRPYFVPLMVEMSEANWLFVSSQYTGKRSKPISLIDLDSTADIGMQIMMFAMVKGKSRIQLTARDPCAKICPQLFTTLHEKEILIATDFMWYIDYRPVSDHEAIAIGAGGYFD